MAKRRSFSSISTTITVAASLLAQPPQAVAQTPYDAPTVPLYRSLQERINTCVNADYNRLIQQNDFVGLNTWVDDCLTAFNQTETDIPSYLQHCAFGLIHIARYMHTFRRNSPYPQVRNPEALAFFKNPQTYLNEAYNVLKIAEQKGFDINPTMVVWGEAKKYINTPLAEYKFDSSNGVSCILDGIPKNNREQELARLRICQEAYNARPVGRLALSYANSVFFLSKELFLEDPNDVEGKKGAYIARDFYRRAAHEGYEEERMTELAHDLVNAYVIRQNRQNGSDRPWNIALGVLAVGAFLLVAGAAAGGSATVFGTSSGAGATADTAAAAVDEALYSILQNQALQRAEALALERAMSSAIPVLVP